MKKKIPLWYEWHFATNPLSKAKQENVLETLFDMIVEKAKIYNRVGRWDEETALLGKTLSLCVHFKMTQSEYEIRYYFGAINALKGSYDDALYQYRFILDHIKDNLDDKSKNMYAMTLSDIGDLYRTKGDYKQAMKYFALAKDISQSVGNEQLYGDIINNMGVVYQYQGDYKKAMDCYRTYKSISEKLGNRYDYGKSVCNMGIIHWYNDEYEKAVACFQIDKAISVEMGNKSRYANAFSCMGLVYWSIGDYDRTVQCHETAKQIYVELGHKPQYSHATLHIGIVHAAKGEFEQALTCYETALKFNHEMGINKELGHILYLFGKLYKYQGKYQKALAYLDEGFAIIKEVGYNKFLCMAAFSKAECLFALGQYKTSHEFNKVAQQVALKINKQSTLFKTTVMEAKLKALTDPNKAIDMLSKTLKTATQDREIALVHYELFKLMVKEKDFKHEAEDHRQVALEQYQKLYENTPDFEFKQRIEELQNTKSQIQDSIP